MPKFPLFWMNETSGRMRKIIELFLNDKPMNSEDLGILKAYIIQYIDGTKESMKSFFSAEKYQEYLKVGVPSDYKEKIKKMNQKELSEYLVNELLSYGIDPL